MKGAGRIGLEEMERRRKDEQAGSSAKHLCSDETAIMAALQYPLSNGPVEGHVHRLKLIKPSMYGQAKFDLIRLRVVNTG